MNRYTRSRCRTAARIFVSQLSGVLLSVALLFGVGALLGNLQPWLTLPIVSAAAGVFVAGSLALYVLLGGPTYELSHEEDLRVRSGFSSERLLSWVASDLCDEETGVSGVAAPLKRTEIYAPVNRKSFGERVELEALEGAVRVSSRLVSPAPDIRLGPQPQKRGAGREEPAPGGAGYSQLRYIRA